MPSNSADILQLRPAEVADATRQLDQLARRAEKLMQSESPNLSAMAPGRDEVSRQVASTLNDVHMDFNRVADQGAKEMHEIAATLRAHTDNIVAAEQDFSV